MNRKSKCGNTWVTSNSLTTAIHELKCGNPETGLKPALRKVKRMQFKIGFFCVFVLNTCKVFALDNSNRKQKKILTALNKNNFTEYFLPSHKERNFEKTQKLHQNKVWYWTSEHSKIWIIFQFSLKSFNSELLLKWWWWRKCHYISKTFNMMQFCNFYASIQILQRKYESWKCLIHKREVDLKSRKRDKKESIKERKKERKT